MQWGKHSMPHKATQELCHTVKGQELREAGFVAWREWVTPGPTGGYDWLVWIISCYGREMKHAMIVVSVKAPKWRRVNLGPNRSKSMLTLFHWGVTVVFDWCQTLEMELELLEKALLSQVSMKHGACVGFSVCPSPGGSKEESEPAPHKPWVISI